MKRYGILLTLLLFALVVVGTSHAARTDVTSEKGVDRPGMDYRSFWLPKDDPELCRQACVDDEKCKAYTYRKPSVQGGKARCLLKGRVPSAKRNDCCVSGVKLTRSPTVATSPPVSGPVARMASPEVQARQFSPPVPGPTVNREAPKVKGPQMVPTVVAGPPPEIISILPKGPDGGTHLIQGRQFTITGKNFSSSKAKNQIGVRTFVTQNPMIPPQARDFVAHIQPKVVSPTRLVAVVPDNVRKGQYLVWVYVEGGGHSKPYPVYLKPQPKPPVTISSPAPEGCARSYHYLGNYPKARENGWSADLQGVTNDGNNWFFTQTKTLWKFPFDHDLNKEVTRANPSIRILKVGIPSDLAKKGYNHFGDFDYYKGYLFIPVERSIKKWVPGTEEEQWVSPNAGQYVTERFPPAIFVFKASNLQFVGLTVLDQSSAGWCAINPLEGVLYTSESTISYEKPMTPNPIHRYNVHIQGNKVWLSPSFSNFRLYDESGKRLLKLKHMQGGAFSKNGCLYTVNGYLSGDTKDTGIMVFDTKGRRIAKSINASGLGGFKYEYHPTGTEAEEPEGLTIWDLDKKGAPGIEGQLHVIMLDNDWPDTDDLYFKHYKIVDY